MGCVGRAAAGEIAGTVADLHEFQGRVLQAAIASRTIGAAQQASAAS